MDRYAVGIDIGGTNIKAVAITESGEILSRLAAPTGCGRTDWSRRLHDGMSEFRAALRAEPAGIAVSAPGLVSRAGHSISWMRGRLEQLQGLEWRSLIGAPAPVPVINDGQAAVIAEAWIGAASGCNNVLMLTLGTGVGGGAIVDGRVLRGCLGRAGHVGHISLDPDGPADIVGAPGSLEDAIGDCTLADRSGGRFATTLELVEACNTGDADACEIWARSIRNLAAGLTSLINVLDPEMIVLGGGIAAAGPLLLEPLARELDMIEWRPDGSQVKIVPAMLGEWAGAVGAGRAVWQSEGECR